MTGKHTRHAHIVNQRFDINLRRENKHTVLMALIDYSAQPAHEWPGAYPVTEHADLRELARTINESPDWDAYARPGASAWEQLAARWDAAMDRTK